MTILVTGGAGFIGSHLCEALLQLGHEVVVIDDFNAFYDPQIKYQNIGTIKENPRFHLIKTDICDVSQCETVFKQFSIHVIIHLAARAGVRPSIAEPLLYNQVNVHGTLVLLELARKFGVQKFIFASSSSVYGNQTKVPFSEVDNVDFPVSPYAATKKAGELLCYNYYHLYQIPMACIRFFTVYGPRQRPEMAIYKFTDMIYNHQQIPVYNHGLCLRDYTYIDDIIQGICQILNAEFKYEIVNLGESARISTLDLIRLIEKELGIKADIQLLPPQPGDVEQTYADITKAVSRFGYQPQFSISQGICQFIQWFLAKNRVHV